MKKLTFFTLATIILFAAQQTYAVSDKANNKATDNPSVEKRNENSQDNSEENEPSTSPTKADTEEPQAAQNNPDDCSEDVSNHGKYVSCIAKSHPGGEVVSAAARSNIGKTKSKPSTTVSPSVTTTVSPTGTPSTSPTVTPSVTVTPTPDTNNQELVSQMKALIEELKELVKSLKSTLHLH